MQAILETAQGDEEHAKILIRMHLGTLATDQNVKIVLNKLRELNARV